MGKLNEKSKKMIILVCCVIVIIILAFCILKKNKGLDNKEITVNEVKNALSSEKEKVIYIENSDKEKCKKCASIKKYLDDKGINYSLYDVKNHSTKDFDSLLQVLTIPKKDFGYPAIIYLNGGIMYANSINISSTSTVATFIKDYKLDEIKQQTK